MRPHTQQRLQEGVTVSIVPSTEARGNGNRDKYKYKCIQNRQHEAIMIGTKSIPEAAAAHKS